MSSKCNSLELAAWCVGLFTAQVARLIVFEVESFLCSNFTFQFHWISFNVWLNLGKDQLQVAATAEGHIFFSSQHENNQGKAFKYILLTHLHVNTN